MSDFVATITQAGINAAINANDGNVSINIGYISVGRQGYEPNRSQTSLQSEIDRVPVQSSEKITDSQWRVMGSFEDKSYTAREVGFHLDDDNQTLFAVYSSPSDPIFYKTANATVLQPFTLTLSAVPIDSITINPSGDISFFYGIEFMVATIASTKMASTAIRTLSRQLDFMKIL